MRNAIIVRAEIDGRTAANSGSGRRSMALVVVLSCGVHVP